MKNTRLAFLGVGLCLMLAALWGLSKRQEGTLDPVIEFVSPDGQARAIVIVRHPPPATGRKLRTEVTILAAGASLPTWFDPDVVFVAVPADRGALETNLRLPREAVPIDITWSAPKALVLRYPADVIVTISETTAPGGYRIAYKALPTPEAYQALPSADAMGQHGRFLDQNVARARTFDLRSEPSRAALELFLAMETSLAVAAAALIAARIVRALGYGRFVLFGLYTLSLGATHFVALGLMKLGYHAFFYSGHVVGDIAGGFLMMLTWVLGYLLGLVVMGRWKRPAQ